MPATLKILHFQLSQCQDRMADLEKELEDPDRPGRIRLLDGNDPLPTELRDTVENVSGIHYLKLHYLKFLNSQMYLFSKESLFSLIVEAIKCADY